MSKATEAARKKTIQQFISNLNKQSAVVKAKTDKLKALNADKAKVFKDIKLTKKGK